MLQEDLSDFEIGPREEKIILHFPPDFHIPKEHYMAVATFNHNLLYKKNHWIMRFINWLLLKMPFPESLKIWEESNLNLHFETPEDDNG